MNATTVDKRLFPKLDDDDIEQVGPLGRREEYAAGEPIIRHGQSDIDLIIVESGFVDIRNPRDGDACIAKHGPRDFIGDVDLLTRRPVIYDAIACGDDAGGPTVVLRVPGDQLRHVLNAVPRLGEKLIEAFQFRRAALQRAGLAGVRVLGPGGCVQTNAVREFLHKNFVPFVWVDSGTPDGETALRRLQGDKHLPDDACSAESHGMPLVDVGDGQVLYGPTLHEVAQAAGVWRGCPTEDVDLAIVGGGPAGLAAAVYAASEGLTTVVLDKFGPGGQASSSSRIENFIGFPSGLSGTDLATRGVLQMLKFGARMVAPVKVLGLDAAPTPTDCHHLHLDCGATIRARCVLATTGVIWKRLDAENAARFERVGVYYACTAVEAQLHRNCDVVVIGGGNSAGQAAMFLAEQCRDRAVHMVVRSPLGKSMSDYLVGRIEKTKNIKVHEGFVVTRIDGKRVIESVVAKDCKTGEEHDLGCGAVFVFIGAEPHTDWLPENVARDKRGYVLTGSDVVAAGKWPLKDRGPCPLETSVPGLLAGGDLRAGSTKRVGFAVGDGSLAVTCVHSLRSVPV